MRGGLSPDHHAPVAELRSTRPSLLPRSPTWVTPLVLFSWLPTSWVAKVWARPCQAFPVVPSCAQRAWAQALTSSLLRLPFHVPSSLHLLVLHGWSPGAWQADGGDSGAHLILTRPIVSAWHVPPTHSSPKHPRRQVLLQPPFRGRGRVPSLAAGWMHAPPAGVPPSPRALPPPPLPSAVMLASIRSCATRWGTPMGAPRPSCSRTPACRRVPAPCCPPYPSPSS